MVVGHIMKAAASPVGAPWLGRWPIPNANDHDSTSSFSDLVRSRTFRKGVAAFVASELLAKLATIDATLRGCST
jgi:hypothetical protein